MINTIMSGFIVSILIFGGIIFGIIMVEHESKKTAFLWLFDSRTPNLQLNLYFGMVALFSLFVYTAFATLVDNVVFDVTAFGKGIGILFGGMGISSIGTGLQSKEDSSDSDDDDDPTEQLESSSLTSQFFIRLFNSKDKSMEMHLFLGALALLGIIFYQGYDLVYISKRFDPEDYGYGMAYAFVGIGAASWSQGVQRKYQEKAKKTRSKPKAK